MKSLQVFSVLIVIHFTTSNLEAREVPSLPVDIKDHCLAAYHHDRAVCTSTANSTLNTTQHFFNADHDLTDHQHLHPSLVNGTATNAEHCCPLWSWVDCLKDDILALEASNSSSCPSASFLAMLKKDEGKIVTEYGCSLEVAAALGCNLTHTDDGKGTGGADERLQGLKLMILMVALLELLNYF